MTLLLVVNFALAVLWAAPAVWQAEVTVKRKGRTKLAWMGRVPLWVRVLYLLASSLAIWFLLV